MKTTMLPPMFRRANAAKGFTIMELCVASLIGAMGVAAVLTTQSYLSRSFRAISNYSQIQSKGRLIMDRFSKDICAASNFIGPYDPQRLTVTVPTSFSADGTVTGTKTVTYSFINGSLLRSENTGGVTTQTTMTGDIGKLSFILYDRLGNTTTQTSSAKGVQLQASFSRNVGSRLQTGDFFSASVTARNKK